MDLFEQKDKLSKNVNSENFTGVSIVGHGD